jgi:hypothetical protein
MSVMTEESFAELSPGLTRHRRQLLQKLAGNSKSPELAEMAKGLLAGRLTPSGIMASGVYDEAMGAGVRAFGSWYTTASEQEKEQAARDGEVKLEQLAEDERAGVPDGGTAAAPPPVSPPPVSPPPRRRQGGGDDDHNYDSLDWLG